MNMQPFFSDGISSNIFLINGEKKLLVDAGMEPSGINDVDILVLTHSHFDHSAMAKDIQEKTGCEIWMSEEEANFFENNRAEASVAKHFDFNVDLDFKINRKIKDGEIIDLGGVTLQAIVTPGHTPGGLCLYEPESKTLFSGDTVFSQGYGRYDLPGGNLESLRNSITRLKELDVNELYSGHGPALKQGVNDYIRTIPL